MNEVYQKKISVLLKEVSPKLFTAGKFEFKSVFGAVGVFIDGKIFASSGSFGVALKLPPNVLEEVSTEKGVKHLKYFPKGHVKKEYAVLPRRILENKTKIKNLANSSINYARQ